MPYLSLNGVKSYYEDEGNGKETLIFGHSMLFNLRMFDQQVEYLKNNYRCIRFDFRGHGKSESPVDGYDLDTLTEDAVELIKVLNCGPCRFIGFSMGGMVALRAALKYPDLINSLILIDTSSEHEPDSGMLRNKIMLFIARYFGLKPLANKVMNMFFGNHFLGNPDKKEIRTDYKKHFTANDRIGIVKAVKGVLFRKGITDKIRKIEQPTTIMVGEKDQLTRLDKAEILHASIDNSVLKVIPRAGHMSPVEEPEIVNTLIENHLESFIMLKNKTI